MNKIDRCRQAIKDHQYFCVKDHEEVSEKTKGNVLIDVQTANAIVTVYDVLNEVNKEKFSSFTYLKMGTIAWDLLNKNRG